MGKKLSKEAKRKRKERMLKKKREEELEEEGMDTFFRNNNYIPAHPEDYEGHYPGNQNNPVLIPYKRQIKHVSNG